MGDPLFTGQLPDTKPKMWLPCVLKNMVSPLNGQAHTNGSFGLELLWLNDIFTGEKWIYTTCFISQTQKTLFEMCRLTSCLVLISASMENITLKAVLFLLTKLRFSIIFLSSLFPSKDKFVSFLSDLYCYMSYCTALQRYFYICRVLF